jgi:hypothetical protein
MNRPYFSVPSFAPFLMLFVGGVGIASRARDIPVKNKRSFWNEKRFQDS